jgi:hypothetical protein
VDSRDKPDERNIALLNKEDIKSKDKGGTSLAVAGWCRAVACCAEFT